MGPLSDDEYRTFFSLLQRFCEEELDQRELFSVPTRFGDVYAHFSRVPLGPTDAYTPLGGHEVLEAVSGPARAPGRPRL